MTGPEMHANDLTPLLEGVGAGAGAVRQRHGLGVGAAAERLRAIMRRSRLAQDRKYAKRVGLFALSLAVLIGGTWGVIALIPRTPPDYLNDDMDDVLDYTLLTKDFNQQPLDRRLAMVKDLVQRLKTMSSSDAAAMAAFAARIQAEARRQLEENIKHLGVDMMDSYAEKYAAVPPEEREDFIDNMAIEFTKMMEDIGGQKSGLSEDDSKRLDQLKSQAKRDQEYLQRNMSGMRADRVMGFVQFLHKDSDRVASPVQQARLVKFMRDATRHFRGQDIDTGEPKGGPG